MRIGAHVREDSDPIGFGEKLGADVIQMFVVDPQSWDKPAPHPKAEEIKASAIDVVVHSSYQINVASLNNRLRMPSRNAVAQQAEAAAELGAFGLVVHGGHVRSDAEMVEGFVNWRKLFERQQDKGGFAVPILIENTMRRKPRHGTVFRRYRATVGRGRGFQGRVLSGHLPRLGGR